MTQALSNVIIIVSVFVVTIIVGLAGQMFPLPWDKEKYPQTYGKNTTNTVAAIIVTSTPKVATSTPVVTTTKPVVKPAIKPKPPAVVVSAGVPSIGTCQIFPASHPYNTDISKYPVHPKSDEYITTIDTMSDRHFLHPDFGGKGQYGMPINIVGKETPLVPITFTAYGSESDPGPYRIAPDAKVQLGTDRHVVVLDKDACKLYEMFSAFKNEDNSWNAASGAIWDLSIIHRRPLFYTSADGAGMAIYPLVIKYEEVAQGKVNHAIRMTVPKTFRGFIWPANHYSGTNDSSLPPMGLRFRLKENYDISHLPYQAKVIATALKKYGTIIAQNGSAWVIGGEQDTRWDDTQLRALKSIPGSAFEVVYTGEIITRQ